MDVQTLISVFSGFSPAFAFFSGIFIGDSTAVAFAFLASQGIVPFWITAFYCWIGITMGDFVFYVMGKTKVFGKLTKSKLFKKMFIRVDSAIDTLSNGNPFKALFYTKFTLGTKILISTHLGEKNVSAWTFLWSAGAASLLWMSIASTGGYFAGKGFLWILTVFKSVPIAFLIFFIVFGVIIKMHRKTHDQIIKKHTKKNAKL